MSGISGAISWAKSHPVPAGLGVVVGGLVVLYVLGAFRSKSSGSDPNVAAYYNAVAAQGISGNQLMQTQIAANASVATTTLNDATSVTNNQIWAANDLALANSNNAAAVSLAPYAVENNIIGALAPVAALPPIANTSTTSKSSSGFLGIGGGSSTTTNVTVTPNPAAVNATSVLDGFLANFSPHG